MFPSFKKRILRQEEEREERVEEEKYKHTCILVNEVL